MPASAIATWFEQFGNSLFDLNIRNALGITTVNKGLIETLASEPEHFLYYNNGITYCVTPFTGRRVME